ncbi:MAG: hypothetical protein ACOYM3_28870 [Terrimicrobiaceae bacterium]
MAFRNLPRQAWIERYEELRQSAMAASNINQRGLTLFLRHGMAAWMDAWHSLTEENPRHITSGGATPTVPSDLRGELAAAIASITLRSIEKGVNS